MGRGWGSLAGEVTDSFAQLSSLDVEPPPVSQGRGNQAPYSGCTVPKAVPSFHQWGLDGRKEPLPLGCFACDLYPQRQDEMDRMSNADVLSLPGIKPSD